jgi:hypothetical protein
LGLRRNSGTRVGRARFQVDSASDALPFWTEARADEIEGGDAAVAERAEEVLLDDLPEDIARPLHPEPVEDMQSIADLVAPGMNELEPVCFTEPGGELRSCGLCSSNLNGTPRGQRAHSHVWRERAGEPAEVPRGERRDQNGAQISGAIPLWEWIGDHGATVFSYWLALLDRCAANTGVGGDTDHASFTAASEMLSTP